MNKLWIAYPVFVLVGIFGMTSFLMGSGQEYFVNVQAKKEKAEQLEKRIYALNRKIAELNKADDNALQEDLKTLLSAMPSRKDVWALLVELNLAASGSGAQLVAYKGAAGNVKDASESATAATEEEQPIRLEATYKVSSFADLAYILRNLQNYLPMTKILEIEYEADTAMIKVESAWEPWGRLTSQVEDELPSGYENVAAGVKAKVAEMEKVDIAWGGEEIKYVANPF